MLWRAAAGSARDRLGSGGELYFCGHHTRRYDEALRAVDAEVVVSA